MKVKSLLCSVMEHIFTFSNENRNLNQADFITPKVTSTLMNSVKSIINKCPLIIIKQALK